MLLFSGHQQRNTNNRSNSLCAAFLILVFCCFNANSIAFSTKNARTKHHIVTKKKSGRKSSVQSEKKYSVQHSKTKLQTLHEEIAKAKQKVQRLNVKEQTTISTLQETQKKKVIISQKVGKLAGEVSKIQDTLSVIQKTESSLKEKQDKVRSTVLAEPYPEMGYFFHDDKHMIGKQKISTFCYFVYAI